MTPARGFMPFSGQVRIAESAYQALIEGPLEASRSDGCGGWRAAP
jgi:hypothetical protein